MPGNWFAIPTLLDDLLTVLLHMTYLNITNILAELLGASSMQYNSQRVAQLTHSSFNLNQHSKKFSLQHNHIQKTHGNIPSNARVLLYYCNGKVGSTLHFLILILSSISYNTATSIRRFMAELLSSLNHNMASNTIVQNMSNSCSWAIKVK